jgi:hypothetical protein
MPAPPEGAGVEPPTPLFAAAPPEPELGIPPDDPLGPG